MASAWSERSDDNRLHAAGAVLQYRRIREDLVETFGVDKYANPFPHFTLYPLAADVDAVESAVCAATADLGPFTVHTDGVGLFPQGVAWLPVAKSLELAAFRSAVVEAVDHLGPPPVP